MANRRSPSDTDARILAAAEKVFAEKGLDAATTRQIAQAAGVNEVTLFRRFRSKAGLLAVVVGRTFGRPTETDTLFKSDTVRGDLEAFAERYEALLREHLLLVRTFIGEIHRHREYESCVLQGIFEPLRSALVARLRPVSRTTPEIVADALTGMILTAVLREAARKKSKAYTSGEYRAAAIEAALRLIE